MNEPTRSRRADAIALAILSLVVSGLAHPILVSSAGSNKLAELVARLESESEWQSR